MRRSGTGRKSEQSPVRSVAHGNQEEKMRDDFAAPYSVRHAVSADGGRRLAYLFTCNRHQCAGLPSHTTLISERRRDCSPPSPAHNGNGAASKRCVRLQANRA